MCVSGIVPRPAVSGSVIDRRGGGRWHGTGGGNERGRDVPNIFQLALTHTRMHS